MFRTALNALRSYLRQVPRTDLVTFAFGALVVVLGCAWGALAWGCDIYAGRQLPQVPRPLGHPVTSIATAEQAVKDLSVDPRLTSEYTAKDEPWEVNAPLVRTEKGVPRIIFQGPYRRSYCFVADAQGARLVEGGQGSDGHCDDAVDPVRFTLDSQGQWQRAPEPAPSTSPTPGALH